MRGRARLFGALTALLVLAAIELGLRGIVALRVGHAGPLLYGFAPDSRARHTVALHDDLRARYSKFPPGVRRTDYDPLTGATFPVRINAQGFRGADFPARKAPGTVRIVTLGASSTFGYHARDDATWPFRLEALLKDRCPDRRYEVLNLGIPHLMSEEIAALFFAEALPLEPDVVTFYEGVNDASQRRERHHLRKTLRRSAVLRTAYRVARDHVLLVRFADEVVRPRVRGYDADEVRAHEAGRAELFLEHLETIRAECARRGIAFVVATQQASSLEVPRERLRGVSYAQEESLVKRRLAEKGSIDAPSMAFLTHAQLMQALRAWAAERGVPLVDAIAALDDRRDCLVSWVHLTPEGNDRIARAFVPTILSLTSEGPARRRRPAGVDAAAFSGGRSRLVAPLRAGVRRSPEVRMDWHELMKKKVTELREMARAKGMEGTSGFAKEKLVEALAIELGIERPHLVVEGSDKLTIKRKIRALRAEIAKAIEAQDHRLAHEKRRRIHHLKRQIRRTAHLTH
jgi:lysophospholipase L1-like esterase